MYLDLESSRDKSDLPMPEQYLADHENELVVLDEVHRAPNSFKVCWVSSTVVAAKEKQTVDFCSWVPPLSICLGSPKPRRTHLLSVDLGPFDALEVPTDALNKLWIRGGFPPSF